jgi:hypothetical protein
MKACRRRGRFYRPVQGFSRQGDIDNDPEERHKETEQVPL